MVHHNIVGQERYTQYCYALGLRLMLFLALNHVEISKTSPEDSNLLLWLLEFVFPILIQSLKVID